ncbi:lysylphosphatidylglycerol synthase transmembrane domain-containing protein [Streptomyces halobius]|uniref:Flippase-like domain-containing protein n=1 Tax=Streptomyces halobius TaxID=2879846 RepID=A0ABY4MKJ4_9ACTN|nr:lysylphosphatidylglycerol synthase transmembrane domain-containing protein [Streptomyces halobius]UQA96940.1 flippase-like domain-containing protein [Streptomyces halobius]
MKRSVWAWLRMLAGVGILVVLLWQLGTSAFLDGLRRIDTGTLLAALALGLLTTVCSAWRWCLVARGLGLRLPLGRAVADYYRALFLNAALPGGVLGDVHRAVHHGRNTGALGRGVSAVVLERAAGQIALFVVGAVVLIARPSAALAPIGLVTAPGVTVLLAAVGCGVLLVTVGWLYWSSRRASRTVRAVRTALAEARRGLLARGVWPGVAVASVVVLAGYLGTFLLAARVAGSTAPAAELVPLMVLALLAMALPLNIGGWGPREGVAAWAFGAAGLGAAQGLTTAVVYGVLALVASLPGAGVLVVRWVVVGLRAGRPQIELEERVLAEPGAPQRRP